MILNNTHIQGIFLYKDDIEYEKGDFVVSGNSIYICTAGNPNTGNNTVLGKDPSTDSENYVVYLGDSLKNIEEYFSYIENPSENEDKILTADLLSQILNKYMIGFDEKGVIADYIYEDTVGDGGISVSQNLSEFISGSTDKILDTIIKSDEINNATFKISRGLSEIKDIFPAQYEQVPQDDLEYLILRQYTYTNEVPIPKSDEGGEDDSGEEDDSKSNLEELFPECFSNSGGGDDPNPDPGPEEETGDPDTSLYRLQELVDPVQGFTAYRYAKGVGEEGSIEWEITPWKSDYDYDFIGSIRKLEEAYRQAIEDLKQEKERLKDYFRFKELSIIKTNNEVILQCTDPEGNNYIPIESFDSDSCVITVIAQLWDTNITISVDILDSYMQISNILTYYLTDTSSLTILPPDKDNNPDTYNKMVTVRVNNGNITNIYYREKYS